MNNFNFSEKTVVSLTTIFFLILAVILFTETQLKKSETEAII